MTVQELIDQLQKIEDKSQVVFVNEPDFDYENEFCGTKPMTAQEVNKFWYGILIVS